MRVILRTLFLLLACPGVGATQQRLALTRPPSPVDSGAVHDRARAAQERFERTRRFYLPWTLRGTGDGPCDEIIGRFCYRYDNSRLPLIPPEDAHIVDARATLLAVLDSAAAELPGDGWIAGQRVRYLVEAHALPQAIAAARECASPVWWCDALEGFALHESAGYASADTAFARALGEMGEEQRCQWTDLSVLLDDAKAYRALDCAERDSANATIWWLADPLYLVSGNERRTEHYAREVMHELLERADNPYDVRWGERERELVLRYGWAIKWEQERPSVLVGADARRILGYHADKSWRFMPTEAARRAPTGAPADAWDLQPNRPRSVYAPAYAAEFHVLPFQLAVFRRGNSAAVVTAFDPSAVRSTRGDTAFSAEWPEPVRADQLDAAAVLAVGAGAMPLPEVRLNEPRAVVFRTTAPRQPVLVSLEALNRRDSVAARARLGVDLAARTRGVISDLLFLDERAIGDSLPHDLTEAVPLARSNAQFRAGDTLVVYWELYDEVAARARITLTVERRGKGLFRRAAEAIGLAGERTPQLALEWEAVGGVTEPGHAVAVALPNREGEYRIRLRTVAPDGSAATAERDLTVRP